VRFSSEEGTRGKAPSSFEVSFAAEHSLHTQSSRMPTLNVTLTNIHAHPRTAETEPEDHTETVTALRTQTETQNFTHKKFFLRSTYIY
jgi:hypothetical protein